MGDRATSPQSAIQSLASSVVALRDLQFSSTTKAAAIDCLVDWVGVAVGGADGVMALALRESAERSDMGCTLVGTDQRASTRDAALVNGTAAHTLELDDIYAPGLFHPGAPVIAAALAVAEGCHASGGQLLHGIIAGYEVGGRVASDLGPAHYRRFHTTGTAGAIAAAAAAADILGLDQEHTVAALSIAATMGAGLQQTFRSSAVAKPLHAGHAAQAGVIAAQAASRGATGALNALDGPVGLGDAMGEGSNWHDSRSRFGSPYIVEQSTVKAYPCCGHTFAAIDAALALRDGVAPRDIVEIVVDTYAAAVDVAGITAPDSSAEARFSIPYAVASALLDGRVTRETFSSQRLAEADRRSLTALTTVRADPAFTARSPRSRGAEVTLVLNDGTRRTKAVPDRKGSPSNPLSREAIEQKFLGLVGDVYGLGRSEELLTRLRDVENMEDVTCLPLAR